MYRLNTVALVMAVGLTIGKHSQALNTRLGSTYLHLLGIEADGGGLGKTLAISDTWCSPDFNVLIFRASGVIPRPPDCGFSLRRYGCSFVTSCSFISRVWGWSRWGRGEAVRVVAAGGGVMNSITLSGLDNVSGKKDVGDLFTFGWKQLEKWTSRVN